MLSVLAGIAPTAALIGWLVWLLLRELRHPK